MGQTKTTDVFASLTDKQHEALGLACQHLTSKQIAQELGVAPVTIDKRIDAVRAKLGYLPRLEVLRLYSAWFVQYERMVDDPTILAPSANFPPKLSEQSDGSTLVFEDSLVFDARRSWDPATSRLLPGLKPSDLGVAGKLFFMLGGSVAIMVVAVLTMAFANALVSMIEG
ncbi:MAG: LuxR C-terminal-related transcriptional regulator [Erythrobacter sp.]